MGSAAKELKQSDEKAMRQPFSKMLRGGGGLSKAGNTT